MIGLQRFPIEHEPYASTPKTLAFKEAADGARPRAVPPQAGGHVRQQGPPAGPRRGDRGGAPEPARPHPHDVPDVRRVRRRLQLRRQEHARLQLPHARQAPGRGDPHAAPTCAGSSRARAAATPSTTPTSPPARPRRPPTVDADLRPPDPQRGHARHDQPAAAATARVLPGLSRKIGTPLLRQRRPADAGRSTRATVTDGKREAADRRPGLRPGDHDHRAHPRRAEDGGDGPRLLPAGRRLPAAPGLDPARRSPRPTSSGAGARARRYLVKNWLRGSPDTDVTAKIADLMLPARAVRRRPAAARAWAATSRTGACSCATAGSTSTGTARRSEAVLRPAAHRRRVTSPACSAVASPTTRCGSCGA